MGFFSWDCRGCGHPMLSKWSINKTNGWMQDVVVIQSDGLVLEGLYDGYGRVISHFKPHTPEPIKNEALTKGYGDPECWHRACWELSDGPEYMCAFNEDGRRCPVGQGSSPTPKVMDYLYGTTRHTPSTLSEDQGFFFGEEHDMKRPCPPAGE